MTSPTNRGRTHFWWILHGLVDADTPLVVSMRPTKYFPRYQNISQKPTTKASKSISLVFGAATYYKMELWFDFGNIWLLGWF
jgi:hypothetical protein